jgi:Timeless PAB domain
VNKQSVPLVPFNDEQNKILAYQPFVLLLHKLGFHLPADANKLFVRIPEFWTAEVLFTIAEKLGPISKSKNFESFLLTLELIKNIIFSENLKFDINVFRKPENIVMCDEAMLCEDSNLTTPFVDDTLFISPPSSSDLR